MGVTSVDRIVRCQPKAGLSLRSDGDGGTRQAVGYAAVFDSWTRLGGGDGWEVREVIRPGAFRTALTLGQDVRALWNHDPNHLLGRSTAGTLRLEEDGRGLKVVIDLPDTTMGRDVAESMSRGDATQMSFAFRPRPGGEAIRKRVEGGLEITEVTITDVDLFDVSIVTYPAYQGTSVALRDGMTVGQARAVRIAESDARIRKLKARVAEFARGRP